MRNQNAALRKELIGFINQVAVKKGYQWAAETKAEFQVSDPAFPIAGASASQFVASEKFTEPRVNFTGDVTEGWNANDERNYSTFGGNERITPQDTGNLIQSITITDNTHGTIYTQPDVIKFNVGIDYTKLNEPRLMMSRYLARTGHGEDRWVRRPGRRKSGAYVMAANVNSDEYPHFLDTWKQRGAANVKRIFK